MGNLSLKLLGVIGAGMVLAACNSLLGLNTDQASPEPTPQETAQTSQPDSAPAPATTSLEGTAGISYQLDLSQSTVTWEARRIVGAEHTGTVDMAAGLIVLEETDESTPSGQPRLAGAEFVIDVTSLNEAGSDPDSDSIFERDVKLNNFFDVASFPNSQFVVTSVEPQTDGSFIVTGDLTIKDQTHQISFPAQIELSEDAITGQATFEIDRTRWGITFESGSIFQNLGDRAIEDEVEFTVSITANRT
ncbi:MAG: hypothetical protein COU69_00540 [Candidatus Pacebacteria bacterium CG10_big_fil_rev_8_21_14_0_10_56_10]|nr:MAG: hypothetical protein COU69_00540 [Candidatus Pacebacteria bacterium CG10_big_fil_rev_8_21_14_0_10_56_10]